MGGLPPSHSALEGTLNKGLPGISKCKTLNSLRDGERRVIQSLYPISWVQEFVFKDRTIHIHHVLIAVPFRKIPPR